ncbi:hypothetical protein PsorP6_017971 [Peronosclerospora sorghi]|uniref:Uncharacterized protein n=1 Tax=Peronosclerospora sorghi TaxID=230839 RepID=A0ACC0WBY8_9STRA|nr:hypothetical protein PsorP6_017971 [Peronosclerospora sorghi]
MVLRGLLDSPVDQSANVALLARIERNLCEDTTDTCSSLASSSFSYAAASRELWSLVLDVVFAPLWLRVRAADLLRRCSEHAMDADEIVKVRMQEKLKLRAIVSSTCQALEELDAKDALQSAQLFTWLGFLETVLVATESAVWAHVFQNTMYGSMLTKMLRLLSICATEVFAALTMCLALFHAHEKQGGRSILVGEMLREMKEGREHLSGALLHVINSCGYPCPTERVLHLWNVLELFGDILADEVATALVYLNDFKLLVDLVIRECTDLPLEDVTRFQYVKLLERSLESPLYLQAQRYRKKEVLRLLESLLKTGVEEDSIMPQEVVDGIKHILVRHINVLD